VTYPSIKLFKDLYLLSSGSLKWFDESYAPDGSDWRYDPLALSQAGLPPTLVLTASHDPIRDQGRAYAAACAEAGVDTVYLEARGTIHGFICLRKALPSGNSDIARCVAVLKAMLGMGA